MSIAVDFYTGTYQDYLELALYNKEPYTQYADNALYFCTDQQIMFKGKTLIGKPYQSLTSLDNNVPNIQSPIEDIFYLYDKENLIFSYKDGQWTKIFGNHICSIEHFNQTLGVIKWDGVERKLTLPQISDISTGKVESLIIDLGKDMILEEGSYYDKEDKVIRLKLAVPDSGDTGEADQYIDIPVGDLVDIYGVKNSSSIILTLTQNASEEELAQDVNKYLIEANVVLAPKQTKPNALQNLASGLYVDVETYADEKCNEAKNYVESRLDIGDDKSITVQSLLNEKANIIGAELESPILNSPVLNQATADSLEVITDDYNLWVDEIHDSKVVTIKTLKDFIKTSNTWGAVSRIATWFELAGDENAEKGAYKSNDSLHT